MEAALKTFFSAQRFAVAGASSDPRKFGHKVLVWYLDHKLQAVPINPTNSTVTVPTHDPSSIPTISSPSALGDQGPQTSLSVITPPVVTRKLLEEAKSVGVRAIWLQPGTFDKDILEWARKEWPNAAIAGTDVDGPRGHPGHDGWCVLVDGEWGMDLAEKKVETEKL